jgi:tRNA dimethylallyltransferase
LAWAFSKVQEIDPKSAANIHAHDARRLARALEVFEIYGKPISELHAQRQGLWGRYDIRLFALTRSREELYQRINARVRQMFDEGVAQEIQKASRKKFSRTAQGMIGVKEIQAFLKGESTQAQAEELIQRNTRHFAKRQMTWFRKEKRLEWIDVGAQETAQAVAQKILGKIRNDG